MIGNDWTYWELLKMKDMAEVIDRAMEVPDIDDSVEATGESIQALRRAVGESNVSLSNSRGPQPGVSLAYGDGRGGWTTQAPAGLNVQFQDLNSLFDDDDDPEDSGCYYHDYD